LFVEGRSVGDADPGVKPSSLSAAHDTCDDSVVFYTYTASDRIDRIFELFGGDHHFDHAANSP